MAKPLHERIASARSTDRVTITNLEQLIDEARGEQGRLVEAHAQASAESVDFALSEADRDTAAENAARHSRNAAALASAIEDLEEKLTRKRESDTRKAAEVERAAALAERDEIAAQLRDFAPPAMERLCELLAAVAANAERMRRSGLHERDAEAEARDVPGNWSIGPSPVDRFARMRIPNWSGHGRCWPREFSPAMVDYAGLRAAGNKAEKEAKAREDARFGTYRITNRSGICLHFQSRHNPFASADDVNFTAPWEGEISHEMAEDLAKKPQISVERIETAR